MGGVIIAGSIEEVKKKMRRIEAKLDIVLAELQRTRDR
jgi:tetrahydromethanopterin S-methyltransferase subunit G